MSEEDETTQDEDGGEDAPATKRKRKRPAKGAKKPAGKGKLFAIIGAVVVLVLVGGGAYYFGAVHMIMGWEQEKKTAELEIGKPVLHELPQIKTDMKTGSCRAPFMRAIVQVQLSSEDISKLEDAQAQVMDAILTHLREQERDHVVGKAGAERLRFELVQILDNVLKPVKVHTVLFKELVLQ